MVNNTQKIYTFFSLILIQCVVAFISEDINLTFPELAVKYGHECDEHRVVTEDGYILKVFNVKGNKSRPVFLQHGIMDSADTFMIRGKTSLVTTLANQGYDVWVGNCRGNKYARGHIKLDPNVDKAFWDFSQHEMGIYDLPAMIDYVLNATDQPQVTAIGHSQGTMIFCILTAEKPEYNDKIKLFISLSPICYLHHMKPFASTAAQVWPFVKPALDSMGIVEVFSRNSTAIQLMKILCSMDVIGYVVCSSTIFAFAGFDPFELEPEFLPVLLGHFPDAVSVKNGNHMAQIAHKKRFCKYDYGPTENYRLYGTLTPPNYNLSNVVMPVALFAARNDNFSNLKDVDLLRDQLKNVVYYHVMERKLFNHIDYVWGRNMKNYLFPLILNLLDGKR